MPRWTRWTCALVALALLSVAPVMAGDDDEPATIAKPQDVPSLEAQLEQPPAETPVPSPEDVEGLTDPSRGLFFEAIEACDERRLCPSASCVCLLIRNQVNCFC